MGGGGGEAPPAHKGKEKDGKERERWREVIEGGERVIFFVLQCK